MLGTSRLSTHAMATTLRQASSWRLGLTDKVEEAGVEMPKSPLLAPLQVLCCLSAGCMPTPHGMVCLPEVCWAAALLAALRAGLLCRDLKSGNLLWTATAWSRCARDAGLCPPSATACTPMTAGLGTFQVGAGAAGG